MNSRHGTIDHPKIAVAQNAEAKHIVLCEDTGNVLPQMLLRFSLE